MYINILDTMSRLLICGVSRSRILHVRHFHRFNKQYGNIFRMNSSYSPASIIRLIPEFISSPKFPSPKPRKRPASKSPPSKSSDSPRAAISTDVWTSIRPPTSFHHKIPRVKLFFPRVDEPKLFLSQSHTLENIASKALIRPFELPSLSIKPNPTSILSTLTRFLTWRQALVSVPRPISEPIHQKKAEEHKLSGVLNFLKAHPKVTTRQPAAATLPLEPSLLFECTHNRPALVSYSERGFSASASTFESSTSATLFAFHEAIPSLLPRFYPPLPLPQPLGTQKQEEPDPKVDAESTGILSRMMSTLQWPFSRKEAAALEAAAKASRAKATAAAAVAEAPSSSGSPARVSLSEASVGVLSEVSVRHVVECWRELYSSGALADFGSRSLGALALSRLLAQLTTLLLEMPAAGRVAASNAELVPTLKAIHRFAAAATASRTASTSGPPSLAHRFFGPSSASSSSSVSASASASGSGSSLDALVALRGQTRMLLAALGHVPPPRAAGIRVLSIDGGGIRYGYEYVHLRLCHLHLHLRGDLHSTQNTVHTRRTIVHVVSFSCLHLATVPRHSSAAPPCRPA